MVSGRVDAASVAALDRAMLKFWANHVNDEFLAKYWSKPKATAAAPAASAAPQSDSDSADST